jgi:hypothetical protein
LRIIASWLKDADKGSTLPRVHGRAGGFTAQAESPGMNLSARR